MGAAFCAALVLAALVLAVAGVQDGGIRVALKATARLSYALFWPAYTGSALAVLFGPTFEPLARRGRDLGLAFAAAHLVHVGLVVWLYRISAQPPVTTGTFVIFGIAVVCTYGLAVLSIGSLARALGRRRWRILRTVCMEYIALAFAFDFLRPSYGTTQALITYLPFAVLAIAGPALRLSALLSRARTNPSPVRGAHGGG